MRISDWSSDLCSSNLQPDSRAVAQARRPTHVDRFKQPPRLVGGQHRRLAAPLTMRRPAHRCGGVHRHDLAYHQPVEQPTHAGELLLDAGRAHLASQRLRSEEHTSELQSLMRISYAVFCLTKKK